MLSPSSHEQRRGSRPNSNFYIGNQSKKGTDYSNALYKTELCRSFSEMGCCRYGLKCRFAHGGEDLRPVTRHKKYKTEPCKNYSRDGVCPYGTRCRFVHEEDIGDMMARSSISSPSPSSAENIFDFARFAGGFSDSKQIAKENQSSLSEQFSLDGDPSGSLASPWNLSSVCHDMEKEENEKDGQMQSIYRKALNGGKKDEFVIGNGWAQDKLSSQTPTQDSDLLLLGTSNSTRVFGNGKILPSHFHHYEDSSWQAFAQPQRRPSFSSLSSVPNGATERTNSIASTTVSSISPVSRSSVFQPAPRKSVIGFAAPASSVDSSFTPSSNGRSKRSVLMEALEPEGSSPLERADLPQLPAFFGNTPPSASPTKADASPTFEEEDRAPGTTKKSVMVSSLSLSLSLVRTTSITTTVTSTSSASSTSTPSASTPASTSAQTADNPTTVPTPPSSALPRDLPPIRLSVVAKKHRTSFDYADLDDDNFQIFSLPRRRTQSMSMSLSNTSSLFSEFQPVSKKSVPKAEPLSTPIAEPGSAPDSPSTGNETDMPSLPGKRLPFFATLAISPKPETQTS